MERTLDQATDEALAGLGAAEFSRDFRSRNRDLLNAEEQGVVDAAKVLVAGCGTVAGSAVEPLVRLGVSDFVLADPDVYDSSNLNRQACLFADVGRPKPAVLAERARAINPQAQAATLLDGITPDNVEAAFDGVTFVCEGIDASMDLWAKYLVHEQAARRRIPVVSGVDLGGQPTLYVFDYRTDPRPFYGRGSEADHREGRVIEAIGWLGVRPIPADFAPIIVDRLRSGEPWPQTVYTAWGIGALMTRALVDLGLDRKVPYVLAVDFHQLVRARPERLRERLRWPLVALRARREVGRMQRSGQLVLASPEREPSRPAGIPAPMLPLVEAIRSAPSAGNRQPWSLRIAGEAVWLEVGPRQRLGDLAAQPALLGQSLGCAIEAAATVARLAVEPGRGLETLAPGDPVAALRLEGFRPDYSRRAGALALRQTNRRPYEPGAPPADQLAEVVESARRRRATLAVFTGREEIGRLAAALAGCVVGMEPGSARRTRRLLQRSGALVAIGWGGQPAEWVASGRALMALWVAASRERWAVHPLAVRDPGAASDLGLPPGGLTVLRIGLAPRAAGRAPRLPFEDLVA